jgi:MYXO-CTERM domain-containing protein
MAFRLALLTAAFALVPVSAHAAGTLLHTLDFEAPGDFLPGAGYSQVDPNVDTCEHDETCTTDSFAIIESPGPVRAGNRALRVTFAQGDRQTTSGTRAEVKLGGQFQHEYDVSFWYGFSVLIPDDWEFASSDYSNVFQIHAGSGPGSSPVVGFRIGDAGRWRITSERDGVPSNQITETLAEFPIQKGIWNDFVMHAVWSSEDDGVLEIWHNGSKPVDKQAWRTIHPDTEAQNPTCNFYVKLGYYGLDRDRVLYHDEFRVAKGTGDLSALVAPPESGTADAGLPDGGPPDAGEAGAGAGGASGAGGTRGGAGTSSGGSGGGVAGEGTAPPSRDDDSGCGCRAASRDRGAIPLAALVLLALLAARVRRPVWHRS